MMHSWHMGGGESGSSGGGTLVVESMADAGWEGARDMRRSFQPQSEAGWSSRGGMDASSSAGGGGGRRSSTSSSSSNGSNGSSSNGSGRGSSGGPRYQQRGAPHSNITATDEEMAREEMKYISIHDERPASPLKKHKLASGVKASYFGSHGDEAAPVAQAPKKPSSSLLGAASGFKRSQQRAGGGGVLAPLQKPRTLAEAAAAHRAAHRPAKLDSFSLDEGSDFVISPIMARANSSKPAGRSSLSSLGSTSSPSNALLSSSSHSAFAPAVKAADEGDGTHASASSLVGQKLRRNCDFCVWKKVKCNGELPCHMCKKKGATCTYSVKQKPGPKVKPTWPEEERNTAEVPKPKQLPGMQPKQHLANGRKQSSLVRELRPPSVAGAASTYPIKGKVEERSGWGENKQRVAPRGGDDIPSEVTEALLSLKHSA